MRIYWIVKIELAIAPIVTVERFTGILSVKVQYETKPKYFVSLFLANGWFWIHIYHISTNSMCSSNAFIKEVLCTLDLYIWIDTHIHKFSGRMKFMAYHYLTWWVSVQYHFLCNRWDNYVKYSIYSVYVCIFFLFWVHRFGFDLNDIVQSGFGFLLVVQTY